MRWLIVLILFFVMPINRGINIIIVYFRDPDRAIEISGHDDMRLASPRIHVHVGETRQVKRPHKFSIDSHNRMMRKAHMQQHQALVFATGQSKILVWQSSLACHVPGHYGAGMKTLIEAAA